MTWRNPLLRVALAVVAIGSIAATTPRFHLALKKSEPAKNDTLAVAPQALKLWFSEKVELKLTSVTLTNAQGATMSVGGLTQRDTANAPIVVPITAALAPSTYTVTWRAPADDGHPSTGKFEFVVRAKP